MLLLWATLPAETFITVGFGKSISFDEDSIVPPGHSMTFKDALHDFSANVTMGIMAPRWAMGLTSGLRRYFEAYQNVIVGILITVRLIMILTYNYFEAICERIDRRTAHFWERRGAF